MKRIFRTLVLASLLVCSFGCDSGGTETGNPTTFPNEGSDPQNGSPIDSRSYFVDTLIFSTCEAIGRCHSIEVATTCSDAWLALTNVDEEIGLTMGDDPDLQGTLARETAETLQPDEDAAKVCTDDIAKLSCFGTGIEEAYDSGEAEPYALGAGMIPASCQAVFTP